MGAVLGMAYVDDFITMEVLLGEFSARKFCGASNLLGAVFGEHKTRWPSSQASCLGVHVRLEEVGSNRITFEPVSGTLERLALEPKARLTQGTCTSAQAAKLRGRAGWAATVVFARAARHALAPLKWRQYQKLSSRSPHALVL